VTITAAEVLAPVPAVAMTSRRYQVVVAGVDGSAPSVTAARWAAEEAHLRGQRLQLAHAYQVSRLGFAGSDYRSDLDALLRCQGSALLARTADKLRRWIPGLDVATTLERADPRRSLVLASDHAGLTVLGCHGQEHRHLGSVAWHVWAHALSPVAVIPQDTGHPDGPVLLGVDGSAGCHAAMGYAFDEAHARGADLFALHARDDPAVQGLGRRPLLDAAEDRGEHAALAEQLAGWQQKYPAVIVRQYVVWGRPGPALLWYAQTAPLHPQMIVIGGHGRGGLAGFLPGSTGHTLLGHTLLGHTLLGHADCPVVVVRPLESATAN